MPTPDEATPLQPGQFRVRSALILISAIALLFAVDRRLRFVPWLAIPMYVVHLSWILWVLVLIGRNRTSKPLFVGWVGTIFGGGVFGVLFGGFNLEILGIEKGSGPADYLVAWLFSGLLCAGFGMTWAALFLPFGMAAAILTAQLFRGPDSIVPSAVCGAVTGYASLGIGGLPDTTAIAMGLLPAVIGGLCAAFAAQLSINERRRYPPLQEEPPARIELPDDLSRLPEASSNVELTEDFRVRSKLQMPWRMKRW